MNIINSDMEEEARRRSLFCQYFINFNGKIGELLKSIRHTVAKVKEYCKNWMYLDGERKRITTKILERMDEYSRIR